MLEREDIQPGVKTQWLLWLVSHCFAVDKKSESFHPVLLCFTDKIRQSVFAAFRIQKSEHWGEIIDDGVLH